MRQAQIRMGAFILREGDKVMQIRNNYDKMVFNGDIGRVMKVDPEEQEVVVAFDESDGLRRVTYEQHELDELVLSYAISVHKSQGSEYPGGDACHHSTLCNAPKKSPIHRYHPSQAHGGPCGHAKALAIAVKNDTQDKRYPGSVRGWLVRQTYPHNTSLAPFLYFYLQFLTILVFHE